MFRFLYVTAHPDDEAGAFGGSILLYHERGVETYVLCLTAGTAARNRGSATNSDELGALRRREFAASCEVLGITAGEVLDYPDGGLDHADLFTVAGDIVRRIRHIRPHVVITFAADGGLTAHVDHAMAGAFTTMAFQWAGRDDRYAEQIAEGLKSFRAQKLYHSTAKVIIPERPNIAPSPITARIDITAYRERKVEAFMQHTTQAPLFERLRKHVYSRGPYEMFHLAARRDPSESKFETDLLQDVIEG